MLLVLDLPGKKNKNRTYSFQRLKRKSYRYNCLTGILVLENIIEGNKFGLFFNKFVNAI
jgi:hypothetical protein